MPVRNDDLSVVGKDETGCLSWWEWRHSIGTWRSFHNCPTTFCVCFENLQETGISHSSMFLMQLTLKLIDSHFIVTLSWLDYCLCLHPLPQGEIVCYTLNCTALGTLAVWINGQGSEKVQKKFSSFFPSMFLAECEILGVYISVSGFIHHLLHSKVNFSITTMMALHFRY